MLVARPEYNQMKFSVSLTPSLLSRWAGVPNAVKEGKELSAMYLARDGPNPADKELKALYQSHTYKQQ